MDWLSVPDQNHHSSDIGKKWYLPQLGSEPTTRQYMKTRPPHPLRVYLSLFQYRISIWENSSPRPTASVAWLLLNQVYIKPTKCNAQVRRTNDFLSGPVLSGELPETKCRLLLRRSRARHHVLSVNKACPVEQIDQLCPPGTWEKPEKFRWRFADGGHFCSQKEERGMGRMGGRL